MIRINCDKTKETYAHILMPQERSMFLVLRHAKWLVGDTHFYRKFWTSDAPPPFENGDFQSIFIRSAPAVNLAKTNRKSTKSTNKSKMNSVYVVPKQERKFTVFGLKWM